MACAQETGKKEINTDYNLSQIHFLTVREDQENPPNANDFLQNKTTKFQKFHQADFTLYKLSKGPHALVSMDYKYQLQVTSCFGIS